MRGKADFHRKEQTCCLGISSMFRIQSSERCHLVSEICSVSACDVTEAFLGSPGNIFMVISLVIERMSQPRVGISIIRATCSDDAIGDRGCISPRRYRSISQ